MMMAKKIAHYLLHCFICAIFIYSSIAYAAYAKNNRYSTIDEWVAVQEKIRILIDPTPNYGNQTASLNVMNQLRLMGFKGTFEVLYNDDPDQPWPAKSKVIRLLALPNDMPDDYKINHPQFGNLHLRGVMNIYEQVKNNPDHQVLEHVELSLDGGDDFNGFRIQNLLDKSATFTINIGPYVQYPSSIKDEKADSAESLPDSRNKFYNIPVYSFKDAERFLSTDPEGIALVQKKPALKTLVEGIKQQQFFMMPLYGTDIIWDGDAFSNLHKVLRILASVRYAQQKDSTLQAKPIVLGVFYDYRREMEVLKSVLNNNQWGEHEKPGSETAKSVMRELDMASVFQFGAISDADVSARINALQPGQIFMLSVEPLPKVVFDGLYNHVDSNMLPPIREGANTLNTLILTGRPHFRCGSGSNVWELGYDYLMTDENFKNTFREVTDYLCTLDEDSADWEGVDKSHWLTHKDLYRQLGEMIIEARIPESAISQYFTKLQVEARKPENDRVRYALGEALKRLQH